MVMIVFGLIAFSIGLLMIIVALKDNSGEPDRVKTRSIVGIILSIISLVTVRGGFS
jgi:formate-dependent nitrite reductase membrane component NrfD